MRTLIIRDQRGHATMDLDTTEAITELERLMNAGMVAVAKTGQESTWVTTPQDPVLGRAEEVRLMWPLAGGQR